MTRAGTDAEVVAHRKRRTQLDVFAIGLSAFALFGSVLFLIAVSYAADALILSMGGEAAEGEVVQVIRHRDSDGRQAATPVIRFTTAGGQVVEFSPSLGDSALERIGLKVPVRYDPENPGRATVAGLDHLWGAPLILGLFSLPFLGIGYGYWLVRLSRRLRDRRVERAGRRVEARLTGIERESAASAGLEPAGWVIRAEWQDPKDGRRHVFHSRPLPFDPTAFLKAERIGIFLDPADPSRYRMDLSGLPRLAE